MKPDPRRWNYSSGQLNAALLSLLVAGWGRLSANERLYLLTLFAFDLAHPRPRLFLAWDWAWPPVVIGGEWESQGEP